MSAVHESLEQFMQRVPQAGDVPVPIPLELIDGPQLQFSTSRDTGEAPAAPVLELIAIGTFEEQWGLIHDMAGGMVQMRTGAPCPLGTQARSEGGQAACRAAYELISASPALSRLILSPESTFFGQVAAIGLHGFACVQVVKLSIEGAPIDATSSDDIGGAFDE